MLNPSGPNKFLLAEFLKAPDLSTSVLSSPNLAESCHSLHNRKAELVLSHRHRGSVQCPAPSVWDCGVTLLLLHEEALALVGRAAGKAQS